ncbi:MAG TPA: flagellar hook protein FlgE [Acidimicrobiales bacterium]|nr:flagellar hook protein FlgE [Acidimicrobiales bacterium]
MFSGVSGLRVHQTMMDVVGNNIANVNTVGFKASTVIFQDALSQLLRGASSGTTSTDAGVNPEQVGLGVKVGGIDMILTQGASQLTGRATDVAIQGDGFFVVRTAEETLFTRAGSFTFDERGFLTDPSGAIVQGWLANPQGQVFTNAPITDIKLPVGQVINPVATTEVTVGGNLSTAALTTDQPISTAIEVVDSLGTKQRITLDFSKTADNQWSMNAYDPTGTQIGSSVPLVFDPATGALTTPAANTPPSFTFTPPGGASALTFDVNFGQGSPTALTQLGGGSTATAMDQNGTLTGYLRSFAISDDGSVSGVFSNGRSQVLGKLALAAFNNPSGLIKAGGSLFRSSAASGTPLAGTPGSAGRGSLAAGTLEMSNVDLAQEFTNLIIAQRGFQANSKVITASDEMLQDLVNLKR